MGIYILILQKISFMENYQIKSAIIFFLSVILFSSCKEKGTITVSIIETTDIHGVIFPYDYIDMKPLDASLAHVASFIKRERKQNDVVFLFDNGDNIQGQPAVYYYNYIDTVSPHLMSEAFNYLEYDAVTAGNHDIEAGHSVYDRLISAYEFPVLAANAVDIRSGKPYFKPYVILEKKGIKVAVFGLITPSVPNWLPEELYSGIEFRDMVRTAELWMPQIKKEDPDLIVGLFHSGWNRDDTGYRASEENGSAAVAYNVPGFDIIFTGHDHRTVNESFINKAGDTLLILNGGSRAENIACAEILLSVGGNRKVNIRRISGSLIETSDYQVYNEFVSGFVKQKEEVYNYVSKVIGNSL